MIMRAFIDTEFTDFVEMGLISIGIVTEKGDEFYAELPVNVADCNEFVKETVVPLLGQIAGAHCSSIAELRSRLEIWLSQFDKVCICYDYFGDFALLLEIFDNNQPASIICANVREKINQEKREEFFAREGMRHNALFDARANLFAYEPSDYN